MLQILGRLGLRARFVIFLSLAFGPLVALVGTSIVSEYRTTLETAKRDVRRLADNLAILQSAAFKDARTFLDTVRHLPDVSVAGGAGCRALMARLKAVNPQFHTMGVVDNDQMITCHNSLDIVKKFGSPDMMKRISRPEAPDFNVGDFIIGTVSKKPTVIATMKLPPVGGRSPGVVFVSMNLGALGIAAGAQASNRQTAALIEMPAARLLARYPIMDVPFGSSVESHPIVQAMRAFGNLAPGDTEGLGQDGVERLFGYAPLDGVGEAQIVASVGLPRGDVLSAVHQRAALSVLGCLVVLTLSFAATWWAGYWTQLRPIARLKKIAQLIAEGDLTVRATIEPWQAFELRALGSSFDAMAERIEEGRRAVAAVAESEARYRMLAENTGDLVTSLDAAGRRVFVSPACRELLGMEPEELMAARPRDIAHPDDVAIVDAMMGKLLAGVPVSGVQYRVRHRDGRDVWVEVGGKPLAGGAGTVLVIRDISERKRAEESLAAANARLFEQANTDGLTGLGNRRSFDARLQAEFALSAAERTDLSLILIDVDWFKRFNDTYGHLAGDECLRLIASTVGKAVRDPRDHAARFGGEELALILPNTSVGEAIERAEAVRLAVEAMNLVHAGSDYGCVTISLGCVSVHAGAGFADPQDMLLSADQALYEVKAKGRNSLRYAMSRTIMSETRPQAMVA